MQFGDPIASGNILVREALQSQNWDAGTNPRWRISADGTASFSGAVTGGSFTTGDPPPKIVIDKDALTAFINLYSGAAGELSPGLIQAEAADPTQPQLSIFSPETVDGQIFFILTPEGGGGAGSVQFVYTGTNHIGYLLDPLMNMVLQNTNDVSITSTDHPLTIGDSFGQNLGIDSNEIQSRDNFNNVPATLNLNNDGGHLAVFAAAPADTYSLLVNGYVQPKSALADHAFDGTTRATTSITYVAASGTANFTMQYPDSGAVLICLSSLLDNTGATDNCSVSFEIRDTNAAGTLRFSASDNFRCYSVGTTADQRSTQRLVLGLPTTGNMFIRPMIRSNVVTNTASMNNTEICAIPVL